MQATQEQSAALEAFGTGQDVVITAGAGTGKTSTLRLLAAARPRAKGLYLAFSKAIATEAAGSFPRSAQARTAHSLAFGWARRDRDANTVLNRLGERRRHPQELIEFLELEAMRIPTVAGETSFPARTVLRWVTDMVTAYAQSADEVLDPCRHRPVIPGAGEDVVSQVAQVLHEPAQRAWEDMTGGGSSGIMPVSHATYLKLWSLAGPTLPGAYVLFDEAQDASPVIAAVVLAQGCQRVMVGDPAQSIYGFTGAIDAMSTFEAPHRLALTRSFRFGDQIAAAANTYLTLLGHDMRLTGDPGRASRVLDSATAPQAILCRGNAVTIAEALVAQSYRIRVHILGGVDEPRRFVDAAEQLQTTGHCSHPELGMFPSWEAAREFAGDTSAPSELRTLVKLVDQYGVAVLRQVLAACTSTEAQADVVVSTVHKAKGREWDRVDLAADLNPTTTLDDLDSPEPGTVEAARDELRVGYVAATRGRLELGAGVIADPLADHGFPTPTRAPAAPGVAAVEPASVVGDRVEDVEILQIPVPRQGWGRLVETLGEQVAYEEVTRLVIDIVGSFDPGAAPDDPASEVPGGSEVPSTPAAPVAVAPAADRARPIYACIADETLGHDHADTVRELLDDAVAAVIAATRPGTAGYTDEGLIALVEDRLDGGDVTVHRRPGILGYSLTTRLTGTPQRLPGSAFGPDYSGPAIVRRVRTG